MSDLENGGVPFGLFKPRGQGYPPRKPKPKGFSGTSVNGGAPHQDAEESKYRDRALERRDLKNEYAPRQWEGGRES